MPHTITTETRPLRPEEFVSQIAGPFFRLTPLEQCRMIEHARAWAIVTYNGQVPHTLAESIDRLESSSCLM